MHFGLFRCCTKLDTKWAELVQLMQKFVPRSRIGFFATNAPDPPHWTLNSCIGVFHSVWDAFWIVWLLHKARCKMGWTSAINAKVRARSRIRIFRKECTQSTQLALNSCLDVFWIVSLLHEARYKTGWTGAINAKVRTTKSHQNFSQGMHPIHPVGPKLMFGCILDCFVIARSSIQSGLNWCN